MKCKICGDQIFNKYAHRWFHTFPHDHWAVREDQQTDKCKECGDIIHYNDNKWWHIHDNRTGYCSIRDGSENEYFNSTQQNSTHSFEIPKLTKCGKHIKEREDKQVQSSSNIEEEIQKEYKYPPQTHFIPEENEELPILSSINLRTDLKVTKTKKSNNLLYGIIIILILFSSLYILNKNLNDNLYTNTKNIKLSDTIVVPTPILIYESTITPEQTPDQTPIENEQMVKQNLINEIIINSNNQNDINTIKSTLLKTDNNILKYIRSINVVSSLSEINCNEVGADGCAIKWFYSEYNFDYATINIMQSSYWDENRCNSFEWTLNHEIGHVEGATHSKTIGLDENYASNYANQHTINKGRC